MKILYYARWGRSIFSYFLSQLIAFAPFVFLPILKINSCKKSCCFSIFLFRIRVWSLDSFLSWSLSLFQYVKGALLSVYFSRCVFTYSYSVAKRSSSWQKVWNWALRCTTCDSKTLAMISKGEKFILLRFKSYLNFTLQTSESKADKRYLSDKGLTSVKCNLNW